MSSSPVRSIRTLKKSKETVPGSRPKSGDSHDTDAVAALAGGIAHQFNNALLAITGNIELLMMELGEEDRVSRYTGPMMASARRMALLTDQLLAYAGGGTYQHEPLCLNRLIEDYLPPLLGKTDPEVAVDTDLANHIPLVAADPHQMCMLLAAVISNAAEAMEDRGRILISTSTERIEPHSLTDLRPGIYVRLTVEDNGTGMDEETRTRIFEPFFSTKLQGRGLGLAAVRGIVKNHAGSISVESEPGRGSKVRILIPSVQAMTG
jgi:two-component system, cell cycle sensor histidine kinase and response regulator CckA